MSAHSRLSTFRLVIALIATLSPVAMAQQSWSETQKSIQSWQRQAPASKDPKPVLRLIYFHGNDRDPLPGYQARLTRIMDDVSAFYRDGLNRYGIANDGIPLERNPDGGVKIHVVRGQHEAEHYTYESGSETEAEIRTALAGSFNLDREYVLILYGQCWKRPDGVWGFYSPYYGKGGSCQKWGLCHAADCELLDPALLTDTRNRIKYWEHYGDRDQTLAQFNSFYLGGIAHELGHGLGLPHECESPREQRTLGTNLMGSGNLTYRQELWKPGAKGSFLSEASAVRLVSHPLFTGLQKGRFDSDEAGFTSLEAKDDGVFRLSGEVDSKIPTYAVIAYVDPDGRSDYDAPTYTVPVQGGKFSFPDIPVPDGKVHFRLVACQMNGATTSVGTHIKRTGKRVDTAALVAGLNGSKLEDAENAVAANRPDAGARIESLKKLGVTDPDWKLRLILLERWMQPVNPPLLDLATTDQPSCYLSDAAWNSAESGWGGTPRDRWGAEPRWRQGLALSLDGKLQEKGLPAHCPATHIFSLKGRWKRFQANVGIRDGAGDVARAVFIVKGDGKEIHRTEALAEGGGTVLDLDITGINELTLVTESALSHNHSSWAVWGMPLLKK